MSRPAVPEGGHLRGVVERGSPIALAVVAAAGLGAALGSGLGAPVAVALLAAPALLLAVLLRPAVAVAALAVVAVARLPAVLVEVHGGPGLLQPFLALLLLSAALHWWPRRRLPTGLALPAAVLAAYGVVLWSSLFSVEDWPAAVDAVAEFGVGVAVVLILLALVRSWDAMAAAVTALAVTTGVLALLGVYQYVTGSFDQQFGGLARADIKNISGFTDDYRISGPVEDANYHAQVLVVAVPLLLGRARRAGHVVVRAAAVCALVVVLMAIVYTYSRGALVALAGVLLLALLVRPPGRVALGAAGAGGLLALSALPRAYQQRLLSIADALPGVSSGGPAEAALSGRVSAQLSGAGMVLDHPLLGVGAGQFPRHYRDYAIGTGVDTVEGGLEPHNLYLQVAAESGLIGLACFSAIVGLAVVRLVSATRRLRALGEPQRAEVVEDLLLGLVGYLLAGVFLHNAYPFFFWFLIGSGLAASQAVGVRWRDSGWAASPGSSTGRLLTSARRRPGW